MTLDGEENQQNLLNQQKYQNKNTTLSILALPEDVIFEILTRCDLQSLGRLSRVCKQLRKLVNSHCVWLNMEKKMTFISGHKEQIPLREMCRISTNWKRGHNKQRVLVFYHVKQLPWLQTDGQTMFTSYNNLIRCYTMKQDGSLLQHSNRTLSHHRDDVSRFSWKGNRIVSCSRDRSLVCVNTDTGEEMWRQEECHSSDIHDVDFHGDIVVSGSRDATVKVWSMGGRRDREDERNTNDLLYTIPVTDRVWSVAVNPSGSNFAMGTAGINQMQPMTVWDTDTGKLMGPLGIGYRNGAGVLNIQYETTHTLLSCGYDTLVRLWDLRVSLSQCVRNWVEPFDSTLYCVKSDGNHAFVTGTARHGMTRLWDMRMKLSIQQYYSGKTSSPVYSLHFNTSYMYLALDRGIHLIDFTIR